MHCFNFALKARNDRSWWKWSLFSVTIDNFFLSFIFISEIWLFYRTSYLSVLGACFRYFRVFVFRFEKNCPSSAGNAWMKCFHFNHFSYQCLLTPRARCTCALFSFCPLKCTESICFINAPNRRQKGHRNYIWIIAILWWKNTQKTSLACCLLCTSNTINSCLHYFSK